MFNLDGEVIGVNSQIYSRTVGLWGLSFAVPVDVVMNVYSQLRESGHVGPGLAGVVIQDVTRELPSLLTWTNPMEPWLQKFLAGSPAEQAGLEVGDIIIRYDEADIAFSSDLPPLVGNSKIDTKVPLEIIRGGKRKHLRC